MLTSWHFGAGGDILGQKHEFLQKNKTKQKKKQNKKKKTKTKKKKNAKKIGIVSYYTIYMFCAK